MAEFSLHLAFSLWMSAGQQYRLLARTGSVTL